MYSKGISCTSPARNGIHTRGFWHLTLCTLLSSQGSDAPTPHPHRAASGQLHDTTTWSSSSLPPEAVRMTIYSGELLSYASKPGPCYQELLQNRILFLLRPFSTAAGRTFGATRGNTTWHSGAEQITAPARACRPHRRSLNWAC